MNFFNIRISDDDRKLYIRALRQLLTEIPSTDADKVLEVAAHIDMLIDAIPGDTVNNFNA